MATVFISYSHKDEAWKDRVMTHLGVLEKQGLLKLWNDRNITVGADWFSQIETELNQAGAVVMLITANFLTSPFILGEEVPRILARRRNEGLLVVPLIVKPCAWKTVKWLSDMQLFPRDGIPVSTLEEPKADAVLAQLAQLLHGSPGDIDKTRRTGPLAGDDIFLYKLPVTGDRLFGRDKELKLLDEAWADTHTRIVTLVAWGGVGKTALVNRWLNELQKENYRGALKVYGWSFYSQGAAEGKQASADEFFQETLVWFGDPHPDAGSAVDKGRRLARLVGRQKTLLILDGLEPLQYPPGEVTGLEGKLKDSGLAAFLKELAAGCPGHRGPGVPAEPGGPGGLCVITTREPVTDLEQRKGFAVKEIPLEHLSDAAGVDLLKSLGVTTGSPRDFQAAVKEYGGHALALTLLGNYLKNVHQGDLRRRDEIPRLSKERLRGRHAGRVMAAYEKWYIKYPKWKLLRRFKRFCLQGPELNILYIMGLFDRPMEPGAIEALKKEPAIPGVTDRLQEISGEDWQWALSRLRGAGLVAGPAARGPSEGPSDHLVSRLIAAHNSPDSSTRSHHSSFNIQHSKSRPLVAEGIKSKVLDPIETIDCHPLVREYFGEKLRQENPEGWQAAHERLYRYYKDLPKKEQPDTLVEMEPLFAAVAHGCQAGRHQEARYEVFWKRIRRGNEAYIIHKLGAFGSYLACLSHFFEKPWGQPAAGLPEHEKAVVLSWAAFGLRAMGRLWEAVQPMKAGIEMSIQQKDYKNAAIGASNLSELLLTLGEVNQAVEAARQCVDYADQSGDEDWKFLSRTTLADALHQAGNIKEAEKWFREAEALQKKRQPEFPYLYSLRGYQFCDLLLGQGLYQEGRERAEKLLEWETEGWLLDISLDKLTLGRVGLLSALEKKPTEASLHRDRLSKAMTYLDEAVEGLRKAGTQDHLPRGLLTRAEGFRIMKDFEKAWDDLCEARDIAELGSMKLFICDYHLSAGRLCRDQGNETDAAEHARLAKELIEETGYFRRKNELLMINE